MCNRPRGKQLKVIIASSMIRNFQPRIPTAQLDDGWSLGFDFCWGFNLFFLVFAVLFCVLSKGMFVTVIVYIEVEFCGLTGWSLSPMYLRTYSINSFDANLEYRYDVNGNYLKFVRWQIGFCPTVSIILVSKRRRTILENLITMLSCHFHIE